MQELNEGSQEAVAICRELVRTIEEGLAEMRDESVAPPPMGRFRVLKVFLSRLLRTYTRPQELYNRKNLEILAHLARQQRLLAALLSHQLELVRELSQVDRDWGSSKPESE